MRIQQKHVFFVLQWWYHLTLRQYNRTKRRKWMTLILQDVPRFLLIWNIRTTKPAKIWSFKVGTVRFSSSSSQTHTTFAHIWLVCVLFNVFFTLCFYFVQKFDLNSNTFCSTVLSWMWYGCTDTGSSLPDQPNQQSPSGRMWQRTARRLSGLQQRSVWESNWVVHRTLEPGMNTTGGYIVRTGKLSDM